MVATETARTVILVLLGLSVLWVIVCVVRNDTATIVRALIVTVLFGVAFYYLNQTKIPTLSVKSIKDDLFPPKPIHAQFEKRTSYINGVERTIYSFAEPGPELTLSMEEAQPAQLGGERRYRTVGLREGKLARRAAGEARAIGRIDQRKRLRARHAGAAEQVVERGAIAARLFGVGQDHLASPCHQVSGK